MANSGANKPVIPVLTGPTGSGKSAALLPLLEDNPSLEVISADSRQIYKYLDIGTDKPSPDERAKYHYHLIDRVMPGERFTAFDFVREAEAFISDIISRKHLPLICGGTGLYIKALTEGIVEIPEDDFAVRIRLENEAVEKGPKYLFERLQEVDPLEAQRTHPHNLRRIIRALEIYEISGRTKSDLMGNGKIVESEYEYNIVCLIPPRERLYEMINSRVDKMMRAGFLKEIESLREKGLEDKVTGLNVIGYKELFDYLNDRISLESAINLIKQNTRRFAKRQITWFRAMKTSNFVETGEKAGKYLLKNKTEA